jgi:hypothetical protein
MNQFAEHTPEKNTPQKKTAIINSNGNSKQKGFSVKVRKSLFKKRL